MENQRTNIFGLSEFLVHKITESLVSAEPSLYLSISGDYWWRAEFYSRIYLRNIQEDGSEVYYLATDEPPNGDFLLPKPNLGEVTILAIDGFEAMLNDLLTNTLPVVYKNSVHGPPPYVLYDLSLVAEHLKPRLLRHLQNDVTGYADDYYGAHFGDFEKLRIKLWQDWLAEQSQTLRK